MALYDYNGRYLMDEELAAMDAKKISEAKGLLEDAHRSLKQAINLANSLKGYAASVYQDKLMSVESVLKEDTGRCEDCARLINNAISNNQGIAEEARRKKEQEAALMRGPSPAREIAATVITPNKNTTPNKNSTSLQDKAPKPAADGLLGGLF